MLNYTITKEAEKELRGLAYHIADLNHFLERYGAEDPDHALFKENVEHHFSRLDALQIPFALQNAVICYAENWRRYLTGDMIKTLFERGYNVTVEE